MKVCLASRDYNEKCASSEEGKHAGHGLTRIKHGLGIIRAAAFKVQNPCLIRVHPWLSPNRTCHYRLDCAFSGIGQ